jgi:hypothetical protein
MRHAGHTFVVALLSFANATGVGTCGGNRNDRRKGSDQREHKNKSGCQAIHVNLKQGREPHCSRDQ